MYRLIVVDDVEAARDLLAECIRRSKPDIDVIGVFADGGDVIDFLKDNSVDIIITDIKMIDKSGLDIAEYVYRNKLKTSVIIVSAYDDFEYAKQAIKFGVFEYLNKPIDIFEVDDAIDRAIENLVRNEAEEKNTSETYTNSKMYFWEETVLEREPVKIEAFKALYPKLDENNAFVSSCILNIKNYSIYKTTKWNYESEKLIDAICGIIRLTLNDMSAYDVNFVNLRNGKIQIIIIKENDDLQSGITVYGNIMYNLERGVQIGGGSDNTVENNAIIECRRALIYDNFGAGIRNPHINPTYVYQAQVYRELFELFKNPEYSQAKWEEHYPTWKNVEGKWNTFHANEDCKFLLDFDSYDALRKYMGYQSESQLTPKQRSSILANSRIMGYVQNGVIKDNLLIGKYFDYYDAKEYGIGRYFTYPETQYRVDCDMDENPRCKRAPTSVLDVNNYEFTLDGSYFNDNVTRTTSDMGLKPETEYVPSWTEDELSETDVNPGNKFMAVAAIYDGNGTLTGVQTFDKVYLYGGQDLDISVKIPEEAKSDWTMSLMLWDGINKMIPVAQKTKLIGSD